MKNTFKKLAVCVLAGALTFGALPANPIDFAVNDTAVVANAYNVTFQCDYYELGDGIITSVEYDNDNGCYVFKSSGGVTLEVPSEKLNCDDSEVLLKFFTLDSSEFYDVVNPKSEKPLVVGQAYNTGDTIDSVMLISF